MRSASRQRTRLSAFVGAVVALAALTATPAASAGSWTMELPCGRADGTGREYSHGLFRQPSNEIAPSLFAFSSGCRGSWSAADPARAGDVFSRNGTTSSLSDYFDGYTLYAPGAPILVAGELVKLKPDQPFAASTRITRIAYHRSDGPAGLVMERSIEPRRYAVLFAANDFSNGRFTTERIHGCTPGETGLYRSTLAPNLVSHCEQRLVVGSVDGAYEIDVPASRNFTSIGWRIHCQAPCAANADGKDAASITFSGLRLTFEDTAAPEVSLRSGELNSGAQTVGGTQRLVFDARDLMGLDYAELLIDGKLAAGVNWPCANRNGGHGTARTPCAEARERQYADQGLTVHTGRLLNGRHSGLLRVHDALGNRRDVPFAFTTYNAGVERDRRVERRVEGFTSSGTATEIVRVGRRTGSRHTRSGVTLRRWRVGPSSSTRPRIRGMLRSARGTRRPIGRARLAVFVRGDNGLYKRKRDITTSRRGRFSYRLTSGSSRDVTFVYRGGGRRRGAIAEVAAAVRARISIAATRRSVANGQSVGFRGRLRGGRIPRGGVLVEVQAYQRGRWRTFQQVRAHGRRGAWTARHRFETVSRRTTFLFRARIRSQHGYPYATGTSKRVRVSVR